MRQATVALAALLAIGIVAPPDSALSQGGPPAFPVTVAQPLAKRVTQWDEYSGRFEAIQTVEIRARVSGFLDKIHFKDGQIVQTGQLLFTIDKRPFEIAVEVAKADIARAKAQVALAENEVERATPLARSGAVTQRDLDQRQSNLSVTRAQLQSAEASLKSAELNLEWTDIRAPIGGRISDRKVDVGNLIIGGQAGAPTLTSIVSQDPVHFVFELSESDFLRYGRLFMSGERKDSRDDGIRVRIRLADEKDWPRVGKMNFVDNQLNPRTGTLRGRALVDNGDQLLQPGVFGRLQLFGGEYDAFLIPDSAVVADQTRKLVFTVGADNVVKGVPVTLGPIVDGLRVVRDGLKADDRLIIQGLANPAVRPGAKVTPQNGQIRTASN
jgi:RND family efflux transporter MFP subunit